MKQRKVSELPSGNLRTNNVHGREQDLKPKINLRNDSCIKFVFCHVKCISNNNNNNNNTYVLTYCMEQSPS